MMPSIQSIKEAQARFSRIARTKSFRLPAIVRLVIFISAASVFAVPLFTAPDSTHAQRELFATRTFKQDAATSQILPAAGCTGASFNQPAGSPLSAGINPRAMVSADFNLDAKPDLAVMGESSNDLNIFLGNGSGGFSKTPASPIALGFSSVNIAAGDFNLDGKPDLIVSISATSNVAILIGDGAGAFTMSTLTVPAGSFVGGLVVSDFNNDGKQDFAVANFSGKNVSIMLGNGTGGFSAAPGSPAPAGTNPAGVTSGDFNKDGKLDLAVSNVSSNDVTVLLGNGNGSFTQAPQSPVATMGSFPVRVIAGDLNSDGTLDLVTANNNSANVSILIGNGNGTFQPGTPLAVANGPSSVSIADLNLDGKADLLVSATGNDKVHLFLGNGVGGFAQASGSPITTGNTPQANVVADYNLDGRPDFAVANYNANTVAIELNTCNAQPCPGVTFSTVAGSPFPAQDRGITIADFNLDGKLDLAMTSANGSTGLSILLGNGSGGLTPAAGSPIPNQFGGLSIASGDFNLDGKPDLATPRSGSAGLSIWIGNGSGGFGTPQVAGGIMFPKALVAADINRDGKVDLVSSSATGGVSVMLGNGTGGFSVGTVFPAGSNSSGVAVADFNGDGKPDVAVANFGSNNLHIFLGDGTGALTQANGSPIVVGTGPDAVVSGDFNRDGKPDLAVANVTSSNVTILLGSGNGSFTQVVGSPFAIGANPSSLAAADFNLDGTLDLAVATGASKTVSILVGNGSGSFSPGNGSPLVGINNATTLAAGDFDLDGRPDLAIVNNDVSGVTVNLNACAAPAPTPTPTPTATATPTPTPTPTPVPNVVQFNPANYGVTEACTAITVTINRSGDTSTPATVDYSTADVTATARTDYVSVAGTLQFAPGDTSKSFVVLINDDSIFEGAETFSVTLSNPSGVALGAPSTAGVTIGDNPVEPPGNVIDDAQTFVCQNYHDFLNRQPDQSGWDFWTNQITSCGADAACREARRVNVSAAFLLSIESQNTGYLIERLYKTAYGNAFGTSTLGGNHQLAVPVVRFSEFLPDTQQITKGVIVLQPGWEQVLETNTQSFISQFVQRSRFKTAFPLSMTPAQFVDTLNANAGTPLSQTERDQLVSDLSTNVKTRAQVLRAIATDADLANAEFNRAFVLMEYFGYLRRNPNDPQDTDYTGFDFWLTKLNQFNGNYVDAELVKAFLSSTEYRQRFGP